MKRLSEINDDEYVMYETYNGKEEYVPKEDIEYYIKEEGNNIKAIYSTTREVIKIGNYTLEQILEYFKDETYETWTDIMYDDLFCTPEWVAFVKKFNEISENNPTYYKDEKLIID